MNNDLIQSIIVGCITGTFSAGAVYGIIKTELKFLRRDVNELRHIIFKRKGDYENV